MKRDRPTSEGVTFRHQRVPPSHSVPAVGLESDGDLYRIGDQGSPGATEMSHAPIPIQRPATDISYRAFPRFVQSLPAELLDRSIAARRRAESVDDATSYP